MSISHTRGVRALLVAVTLLVAFTDAGAADAVAPAGELSLARAVDAALRSNPDLRVSAYEINAAQARLIGAAVRPNPELSVELENFAGGGANRGSDALELTLSLSQVVELGGKRSLRRALAQFEVEGAEVDQRARELDTLAEVTRAFIEVVAAQERARFAAEASALAASTIEAIDRRVGAGRSPQAELSRARVASSRAHIEQGQADSELRAARYALAATWGSSEPTFERAQAELFALPATESFDAVMTRVEQSPDLLRFASASRQREAELRLARTQARPDLTVSLGVRRFEEMNDHALVAGFSMPLPISDRNLGAIREAEVRVVQGGAQHDAAVIRIRATVRALYEELGAARARIGSLRGEALPQAERALEETRSGYQRGRFSLLELLSLQEELLALRAAVIDAAADYHRTLAEIERLTGGAIVRTTP